MKSALKILPLLALLLLPAQAVLAQGTTPAAKPAPAKPQVDVTNYGDWRLECIKAKDGRKLCQVFQMVVEEQKDKKKRPLLMAKIMNGHTKDKDGKEKQMTRMLLTTPLGILLPAKLSLKLDAEKAVPVPYLLCTPEGCIADLALDGELLQKIRAGKKLTVGYRQMDNKTVSANVSLNGFNAALKALGEAK